jgi:hypothetical protein
MTSGLSKLAAICLAGALALVSVPAQAQLFHRSHDGVYYINPLFCFTDYQVRRAVAAEGFTNIYLNAPVEAHLQVKASRGGHVYLIDFNICLGRIVGIRRLR